MPQNTKLLMSLFWLEKKMKVLATSSADLPLMDSCHSTPVDLILFPFAFPPTRANVSLNKINRFKNIACFNYARRGNIITFCISTEITISFDSHSRFFSALYTDRAPIAFDIRVVLHSVNVFFFLFLSESTI